MGVSVLVLGHSGTGKSTSLRNFKPGEIGIFNVAGKPLPFRGKMSKVDHPTYAQMKQSLKANKLKAYVVDDANYLMAFQSFAKANEKGYDKFTSMAVDFEQLLEAANNTNDDTIVYFFMHPDYDDAGRLKPKTIGKITSSALRECFLSCSSLSAMTQDITSSRKQTALRQPNPLWECLMSS